MIRPDFAPAHNGLGFALMLLGRLTEAECSLRSAVALAPTFRQAHRNLGNVLRGLARV